MPALPKEVEARLTDGLRQKQGGLCYEPLFSR